MKEKIELRNKAKYLEPIIRIGKKGANEALINEILKVIKKRKLIKVKILKASIDNINKKDLINDIVNKTNTSLIEAVGNIFVLYYKPGLK
jgi:putative YhbY family RNA-binding protein